MLPHAHCLPYDDIPLCVLFASVVEHAFGLAHCLRAHVLLQVSDDAVTRFVLAGGEGCPNTVFVSLNKSDPRAIRPRRELDPVDLDERVLDVREPEDPNLQHVVFGVRLLEDRGFRADHASAGASDNIRQDVDVNPGRVQDVLV